MDLLEGKENRDEWISHMEKASVSAYKTNAQRNIRVRLTERDLESGPAPVAQLDRVPGCGPGGRRFESCRARQIPPTA